MSRGRRGRFIGGGLRRPFLYFVVVVVVVAMELGWA